MGVLSSVLNNANVDGSSLVRKIKAGEFRIMDEDKNVTILNHLTDVLKVVPRMNRFENRYLCREYIKFLRST